MQTQIQCLILQVAGYVKAVMTLLITYRLVVVCLVVQHGRPLGAVAPGLHGPQPHLVLWETLQTINKIQHQQAE